jgi:hypothetical protein
MDEIVLRPTAARGGRGDQLECRDEDHPVMVCDKYDYCASN